MPVTILDDRGLILVDGSQAREFLQGLVTCDMEQIGLDQSGFGALLSPQGKIICDFFIYSQGEGFILDAPAALAADVLKRLRFYRLRAKVDLSLVDADWCVMAGWAEAAPRAGARPDPRLAAMGWRALVPRAERSATPEELASRAIYDGHRINLCVPEGGLDFVYGDTFPHEANLDRLNGVSFGKGCYVGQEVVSRMQHRGLGRKRIVPLRPDAIVPPGADILASDILIGRMGSSHAASGAISALGLIRLDKAQDALASGTKLTCAGVGVDILPLPSFLDGVTTAHG